MKKTVALAFSIFALASIFSAPTAQALELPAFSSCPAPGGVSIASYSDGIHGVPGDATTYIGSDEVYKLNESQVVQCLCPANTSGIQTWWWKASELTQSDILELDSKGWIYVPNGSLWGLDEAVYYAKNLPYSCGGIGGGDNGESDSNTSASEGVGGASTSQVLGAFAATGNSSTILAYITTGLGLFLLAWLFARAAK